MRAITHYICSFLILTIYGGQVCPFVESLTLAQWAITLTILFTLMYVVRYLAIRGVVERSPYGTQPVRQYILEFVLFATGGFAIASYNYVIHEFPAESGSRIFLGFIVLSFFMATDLALERERWITVRVSRGKHDLRLQSRYIPVTRKFTFVTIACAISVTAVLFLVFSKDLDWLTQLSPDSIGRARLSILAEIAFVMLTLLGLMINLILSYSRNMGLFLKNENGALMEVTSGNLNAHVPVSTNDEFGIMAGYTNQMIDSLREQTRELLLTQEVTIHGMASLAETRDNETGKHILRTQRYVRLLAERLKDVPRFCDFLDDASIELLFKSAPLHDIGKVGVPDRILLKPGKLTPEEFDEMKKHTIYGRDALLSAEERIGSNSFLSFAKEIAYTHHEKWDGSGYPQGLKADEIPCAGRLMALADVYDALISKRVYKPAFTHEKAKTIILEGRGTHFDPDVVDMFMKREEEFRKIARDYADL
ncbi:MAG: HD domain-containing protein [bacterium]|nr:HD domain-containing protein [bacterium]